MVMALSTLAAKPLVQRSSLRVSVSKGPKIATRPRSAVVVKAASKDDEEPRNTGRVAFTAGLSMLIAGSSMTFQPDAALADTQEESLAAAPVRDEAKRAAKKEAENVKKEAAKERLIAAENERLSKEASKKEALQARWAAKGGIAKKEVFTPLPSKYQEKVMVTAGQKTVIAPPAKVLSPKEQKAADVKAKLEARQAEKAAGIKARADAKARKAEAMKAAKAKTEQPLQAKRSLQEKKDKLGKPLTPAQRAVEAEKKKRAIEADLAKRKANLAADAAAKKVKADGAKKAAANKTAFAKAERAAAIAKTAKTAEQKKVAANKVKAADKAKADKVKADRIALRSSYDGGGKPSQGMAKKTPDVLATPAPKQRGVVIKSAPVKVATQAEKKAANKKAADKKAADKKKANKKKQANPVGDALGLAVLGGGGLFAFLNLDNEAEPKSAPPVKDEKKEDKEE